MQVLPCLRSVLSPPSNPPSLLLTDNLDPHRRLLCRHTRQTGPITVTRPVQSTTPGPPTVLIPPLPGFSSPFTIHDRGVNVIRLGPNLHSDHSGSILSATCA